VNHSTVETELEQFALDAYKERTGDYHAAKIPKYTDFIEVKAPAQVPFPTTIKKYGLSRFDYWRLLAKQNIAIGMIKEDAQTARALADYLDRHSTLLA
jgi:hypothetical protein